MGIGAKLQKAIEEKGTNVNEVAKRANVNPSVLYSIIRRDSKSVDINVLILIANILGVSVEYFSDSYEETGYYTDSETAKMAQQIHDNPALGFLFDAAKDASPEDLKMAADILNKIKNNK